MDKQEEIGKFHRNIRILDKLVSLLSKFDDMASKEEIIESIKHSPDGKLSQTAINSFYSDEDKKKAKKLCEDVRDWRTTYNSTWRELVKETETHPDDPNHPDNIEEYDQYLFEKFLEELEHYHEVTYGELLPFIYEDKFVLDKDRLRKNQNIYCYSTKYKVTVRYNHDKLFKKFCHLFLDKEAGQPLGDLIEVDGGAVATKGGMICEWDIPENFTGNFDIIKHEDINATLFKPVKDGDLPYLPSTLQGEGMEEPNWKKVSSYIIREAWLGEGYMCKYKTKDGETVRYDHDAFFYRNMKKIIANKTWQDPKKREVSDGKRKKLPYGEESL